MGAIGGALLWVFEHSIGWVWDHTLGAMVARSKRKDRQRADLTALADALGEAVAGCHNIGQGDLQATRRNSEIARQRAEQALAISTRIPDEELARVVKVARDAVLTYLNAYMSTQRSTYTDASDAAMDRIRELQRGLR